MKPLRIAIDAMGGDFAPTNEIEGAILAANHFRNLTPVEFVFVGREDDIKKALARHDLTLLQYSIVHTDDVITMDDEPALAFRTKKNSSLIKGIELHRNGDVDAFISAGNTGAVMSSATLILGRIKGVSRPTIGSFLPTVRTQPTLLTDVGANVDCKPRFLYEFAVMGSIYAKEILGIDNPRVGLLNVGEEETKGNSVVLEAYSIMKQSKNINFLGNVEGRDIFAGTADVVVCDGFTGNIVLKFAESVVSLLRAKIKEYSLRGLLQKISVAMMIPTFRKVMKEFDYQEYGGVPLLGVKGVVIIGHGKSTPYAIKNMLLRATEVVQKQINKRIEEVLADSEAE